MPKLGSRKLHIRPRALQAYRENKWLRSDNRASVVGLDIFCFKILIRFGGLFLDKGASDGEEGSILLNFMKVY